MKYGVWLLASPTIWKHSHVHPSDLYDYIDAAMVALRLQYPGAKATGSWWPGALIPNFWLANHTAFKEVMPVLVGDNVVAVIYRIHAVSTV